MYDEDSHCKLGKTADPNALGGFQREPYQEGKKQTIPDDGGKIIIEMLRKPAMYEIKPHFFFRNIVYQCKKQQNDSVDTEGNLLYFLNLGGEQPAREEVEHPGPQTQGLGDEHAKGISLDHGKRTHAQTHAHEGKAGKSVIMRLLKKQPVKRRKKQVNNNQGAKKPEMPQIAPLQQAVIGQTQGINHFLSEKEHGDGNQKIPGQHNFKDAGDLVQHIGIAGMFPGKKQIAVNHKEERDTAVAEVVDRIIVHTHGMESDHADAGQRFNQVQIRIPCFHRGTSRLVKNILKKS